MNLTTNKQNRRENYNINQRQAKINHLECSTEKQKYIKKYKEDKRNRNGSEKI